ncbi:hypothetical protein BH23PLA1_BH23PLA1_26130 [soil metagenome]
MSRDAAVPARSGSGLLDTIGRNALDLLGYLGGIGILFASAVCALVRPRGTALPLRRALDRQLQWLLGTGVPLVGLAHVGMGSFLAMQAFFGATFVEGAGPVVGLGLVRNVAPLLAGILLAGMMAARWVPELRTVSPMELESDPTDIPDRDVARGVVADDREPPEPARLVLVRVLAAMVAGPVLAIWGAAAGMLVGWSVSVGVLHVPSPIFFGKFLEMLWLRDALGLTVKPALFGGVTALIVCHEGLRLRPDVGVLADADANAEASTCSLPVAGGRAVCLSTFAILVLNLSWFTLVYLAGPPFGPTVLAPPSP